MKITIFFLIAVFLFLGHSYSLPVNLPYNLRVPLDESRNANRMKSMLLNNENVRFKDWLSHGERKILQKAVYGKFKTKEKRIEALEIIYRSAERLREENIEPWYVLSHEIPATISLINDNDIGELKEVCSYIVELHIESPNSSDTYSTVGDAIMAAAKAGKDIKDMINSSDYLVDLMKEYPFLRTTSFFSFYVMPAAVEAAKGGEELKNICSEVVSKIIEAVSKVTKDISDKKPQEEINYLITYQEIRSIIESIKQGKSFTIACKPVFNETGKTICYEISLPSTRKSKKFELVYNEYFHGRPAYCIIHVAKSIQKKFPNLIKHIFFSFHSRPLDRFDLLEESSYESDELSLLSFRSELYYAGHEDVLEQGEDAPFTIEIQADIDSRLEDYFFSEIEKIFKGVLNEYKGSQDWGKEKKQIHKWVKGSLKQMGQRFDSLNEKSNQKIKLSLAIKTALISLKHLL